MILGAGFSFARGIFRHLGMHGLNSQQDQTATEQACKAHDVRQDCTVTARILEDGEKWSID